jgi:hypothetical protein
MNCRLKGLLDYTDVIQEQINSASVIEILRAENGRASAPDGSKSANPKILKILIQTIKLERI